MSMNINKVVLWCVVHIILLWYYRIVPGKCPHPNFDSFVVFEVLRVTIDNTVHVLSMV